MSQDDVRFRATLGDPSAFTALMAAVTATLEEANFTVDGGGLSLRQMDRDCVSLVEARVPPGVFDEYRVEAAGLLRLSVKDFLHTLGKAVRGEAMTLETDPERMRLHVRLRAPGKTRAHGFELAMLDPTLDEVPSPVLDYAAETTIKVGPLLDAVRDADLVTEYARVKATPDLFEVYGEGDKGSTYNTWERGAEDLVRHEAREETETVYSASRLLGVISPCRNLAEAATVRLGRNMPLRIEYGFKRRDAARLNGADEAPALSYYVAPMVV